MSDTKKETLHFQAEVKQLLHLMIHSLYSHKEIFLRELISNAADAADKLRFYALSHSDCLKDDAELNVKLIIDEAKKTLTISDNGIGMSRQEAVEHLGTIAKSGTKEFLGKLGQDGTKAVNLIGQFGVGFYSAFIVADQVEVKSRRADLSPEEGVRWVSNAQGEFTVETMTQASRGTEVILYLKKECEEFLEEWRLREVIKKYSDHINLPVKMKVTRSEPDESQPVKEGELPKMKEIKVEEVINEAKALWTLPKNKIKDEEYQSFYKQLSHDFSDPLTWVHKQVEGKIEYTLLLYIPSRAPFDLYEPEYKRGLKLYVQRVFILDQAEAFLPRYLRFVKGVVDCKDLSLNVSREILQQDPVVEKIRSATVKAVLEWIEKLAADPEKYKNFWAQFGRVLKEGIIEDYANRERIARLLRFYSSKHKDAPNVSLEDYLSRLQPKQEKIYYLTAESLSLAEHSPHLEIFRKKEIEVLLLTDRVDEWFISHLHEFQGKKLQSAAKDDLSFEPSAQEKEKKEDSTDIPSTRYDSLLKNMKEILGARVKEVRLSKRLTDSPACLVLGEQDMSIAMQHLLQQAGHSVPAAQPILEINPTHPLMQQLYEHNEDAHLNNWVEWLYSQALLIEGGKLENPIEFVKKINELLSFKKKV